MNILDIIIRWAIPIFCSGTIAFIVNQVNQNKSLKCSMVALLRGQIVTNCEQYNKLGYLPDYARYTINELGTNYEKLGGNHGIQELITKTNQLPPIKMKKSDK